MPSGLTAMERGAFHFNCELPSAPTISIPSSLGDCRRCSPVPVPGASAGERSVGPILAEGMQEQESDEVTVNGQPDLHARYDQPADDGENPKAWSPPRPRAQVYHSEEPVPSKNLPLRRRDVTSRPNTLMMSLPCMSEHQDTGSSRAARQLRIRAHGATGQVAGEASY